MFCLFVRIASASDFNKYTKRMIHKRTDQKYPLVMLKMGPHQVSL